MTVEPYVIIPLSVYRSIQTRLNHKSDTQQNQDDCSPSHSQTTPQISNESTARASPPLPLEKDLTKHFRTQQVKKLLQRLQAAELSELLALENLSDLISDALSSSHRPLKNEKQFYVTLFEAGASDFIKNKYKIKKYLSGLWNII